MKKIKIYHNGLILKPGAVYKYKDIASNKNTKVYDPTGKEVEVFSEMTPAILNIDKRHEHLKCPAVTEWYKNTWVVHQPIDINLIYDSNEHKLRTNADQLFDLRPIRKFSEKAIIPQDEPMSLEEKNTFYPEAQFHAGFLFWTKEKNMWIEMSPHPDSIKLGLELTPATWPMSVWTRPTTFAFLIKKKDTMIEIPKGTKLYYIKFISKKHVNFEVDLEFNSLPRSVYLRSFFDTNLKSLIPWYSWKLIEKRLKSEELSNKCPFFKFLNRSDEEDKLII